MLSGCSAAAVMCCLAVESKHIAAVLKSQSARDLLVTLAGIEAVIRAQASHLTPPLWGGEQQRHQAEPYETSSSGSSSYSPPDILQHSQDRAPVLLLPFAMKLTDALLELMQQPRQQQHWLAPSDRSNTTSLLCVRLFTLMITVLTLCQAALAGVRTSGEATQQTADVEQHLKNRAVLSTASEVSDVVGSVAYHWRLAADRGTPSATGTILPAVLLLRAVTLQSCGLCQLFQTMPAQHRGDLNGAANAEYLGLLSAGLAKSVIHVIDILPPLATAAADPDEPAPLSGTVHENATTAAEPVASHWLRQGANGNVYSVHRRFVELLQQSEGMGTAVQSALQLGANSMEADAHVSSVPQTQGSWPVGKMHDFADTLLDLCKVVSAAFPLRYCCSNALCVNLTKLSEWQLVCGKACVCAGCGVARYCSTSCQKQHWSLHKPMCNSHHVSDGH